jgi:hypothetical protein
MDTPDTPHTSDTDKQQERTENGLSFGPTDPEIAEMRRKYSDALQQEFAREQELDPNDGLTGLDDPVSNVEKYTRKFFRQNLPDAAAQIVWLSANSDSDSIRLRASQFIVKEALEDARAEGDPIRDLLQSLQMTPTADASHDH